MKTKEIERRFLLKPFNYKRLLQDFNYNVKKIEQFYLPSNKDEALRYRSINNISFIQTIKKGHGLEREEKEKEVSKKAYLLALKQKEGFIIYKKRVSFQYENYTLEIDVFEDYLKGLYILEVEFPSVNEANKFNFPRFLQKYLIEEITQKSVFNNKALSLNPFLPAINEFKSKPNPQYKAAFNFTLHPFINIEYLLKTAFSYLAKVALNNLNTMKEDKNESENLHQFRVSLRKIRSYLELFAFAFEKKFLILKRQNLQKIFQYTNSLRDLDVFLEEISFYNTLLPNHLQNSFDEIKKELLLKQQEESIQTKEFLESAFVQNELESLINLSQEAFSQNAKTIALFYIDKRLQEEKEEFFQRAKKLTLQDKAKNFHKLRIFTKKLRYLSEIYALFEEKAKKELEYFKTIQTILGKHQDGFMQRKALKNLQANSKELQEAIKFLRKFLKKESKKLRKNFFSTLISL